MSDKKTGKKREYKVGKGKPPAATRFKPGNQAAKGHGRPKTLKELRALVQELGEEPAGKPGETQLRAMLRRMYESKAPVNNKTVLEYGWGKVPDETKLTGDKNAPIVFKVIYGIDDPAAQTPPAATGVHPEQGEAEGSRRGETRG